MACPKCGCDPVGLTAGSRPRAEDPRLGDPTTEATCPRCGVVIAKYRARPAAGMSPPPRSAPATSPPPVPGAPRFRASFAPPPEAPATASRLLNVVLVFGLLGALAGGVAWFVASGRQRPVREAAGDETSSPTAVRSGQPSGSAEGLEPATPPPLPPPPRVSANDVRRLSAEDRETLNDLANKLHSAWVKGIEGDTITQDEARRAEELAARHPDEDRILDVAEAVLLRWAAVRAWKSRTESIEILRRAVALKPRSMPPRSALLRQVALEQDWPLLEQEARAALELDARSREAHEALGQALMRLGRDREAMEELKIADDLGYSPLARTLLSKLQKGQKDEGAMKEQAMGNFTLRYEGVAHEGVGSDVLRALEHHFATLVSTFDHRPSAPIAVVLYTEQGYYTATNAPRWSGGLFDNTDGRIRLPVGGLSSLPPEIESVLLHELTHAFVADISHGRAPSSLHEGLAQYMEGKRLDEMLNDEQLRAVAAGRVRGPARVYLEGLAVTEYLIEQRGWGGIKDLLQAMGQGERDPFDKVYGRKAEDVTRAAQERFQLQHGT